MTQYSRTSTHAPNTAAPRPVRHSPSPLKRAWRRFKQHRLGYWSLLIFVVLFVLSLGAECISNDRPLVVRYHGNWYFPIVKAYPEMTFGGISPHRRTTLIRSSGTSSRSREALRFTRPIRIRTRR